MCSSDLVIRIQHLCPSVPNLQHVRVFMQSVNQAYKHSIQARELWKCDGAGVKQGGTGNSIGEFFVAFSPGQLIVARCTIWTRGLHSSCLTKSLIRVFSFCISLVHCINCGSVFARILETNLISLYFNFFAQIVTT